MGSSVEVAALEFATAPAAGEVVNFYIAFSPSPTDGTANPSGNVLRDWSGRGHHATMGSNMDSASAWVVDRERGHCLNFDGTNDSLEMDASQRLPDLPTTFNLTIMLWVNANITGTFTPCLSWGATMT